MTKAEAITVMVEGRKVTHRFFASWEWVELREGNISDSGGYIISQATFWADRNKPEWEVGWEIS